MVNEETYRKLIEMKCYGLAAAFQDYLNGDEGHDALDFGERFGMMVDREWTERIEPTIADAVLDRLVSSAHRIALKGKATMRGKRRRKPRGGK